MCADFLKIKTEPLYGAGVRKNPLFQMAVTMTSKSSKKSCIVYDKVHFVNKPIELYCDTTNLVAADDWVLSITATSLNNKDKTLSYTYKQTDILFEKGG